MLAIVISSLNTILQLYSYVLVARILISWFPDVARMAIGRWIIAVTEPYFAPFRRFIPPLPIAGIYLDISVLVAIVAYEFAANGLNFVLVQVFHALNLM